MRHSALGLALTLSLMASAAHAQLVNGDTITIEEFDATNISPSNPPTPLMSFNYVAGQAPINLTYDNIVYAELSSNNNVITVDYAQAFSLAPCAQGTSCFEGAYFTVAGKSVSASSLVSTNIAGLTTAKVGAQSGGAWVNLQGLSVPVGSNFQIAVTAVPEPAFIALFPAGLGLVVLAVRRRRTR